MVAALLAAAVLALPSGRAARLRAILPSTRARPRARLAAATASPHWRPACVAVPVTVFVAAVGGTVAAVPVAVGAGALAWFGTRRWLATRGRTGSSEQALRLAATGDLLAACLRAGLPVPVAVRAVAGTAPAEAEAALRATSELLALGAEPAEAWEPARGCAATAELARAACRTARSGSALAGAAGELAERARASVADEAEARAQRAGVLITGPLALCFLPAFLCLGVIPVVIGLAGQLTVLP
ncbi:hypothetical protein BAY60_01960 [Prauserella muralis]|uniref:Type II secretion system protein GspF domain-containing protein n=1 Tax=Prauserella muralis TaxID=588067 RepID=A0A2V4BB97_9PSEU|nr:hypothetical protein BAY60_01960 [Prauserella muralis]